MGMEGLSKNVVFEDMMGEDFIIEKKDPNDLIVEFIQKAEYKIQNPVPGHPTLERSNSVDYSIPEKEFIEMLKIKNEMFKDKKIDELTEEEKIKLIEEINKELNISNRILEMYKNGKEE